MKIRVSYTGRSYDSAAELPEELELSDGADIDAALEAITAYLQLPATCLIAINGEHLGTTSSHTARQLADGDDLVLISPVAGG